MKNKQRGLVEVVLIITLFVLAVASMYFFVFRDDNPYDWSEQELANEAILQKAIDENDPSYCAEISGMTPYPIYGPADEYLGEHLIDEKTAKLYCDSNAKAGRLFGP